MLNTVGNSGSKFKVDRDQYRYNFGNQKHRLYMTGGQPQNEYGKFQKSETWVRNASAHTL